jgi:hypothetical protein
VASGLWPAPDRRNHLIREYLATQGWGWTPTLRLGPGTPCQVHLRADELPTGRLVVAVSEHLVAVIDGVVHDTCDLVYIDAIIPRRCVFCGSTQCCVRGYFAKGEAAALEYPDFSPFGYGLRQPA